MGNFANTLLYEVPTYLAECSIEIINRKTKRKKAMANFKIELDDRELDFITEVLLEGINNYQRLSALDEATGRKIRMRPEFVDSFNFQLNLYTKLIKILQNENE